MGDQAEAQRDLIAEMSRDIVADVAPDELPLFRMNSTAYFKNPKKALESREGQDEALGFGIEAMVPLLTPVIIAVVTEVISNLDRQPSSHVRAVADGLI